MNKGTSIVGFILSFIAGMAVIWAVDRAGAPHGAHGTQATAVTEGAPRSANPGAVRVDLHVMAQCPYGVQAENAFKDVVAKFGGDVDMNVEYIGQTGADGALSSMHGPNEVKGDLLQVCAKKYSPNKAFDFILCQNKDAKTVGDTGAACAKEVGADAAKIVACADGQEGKDLLKASFDKSNAKGARGSPTIFINNNKYEGGRKPTDFMKGICNAASGKKPAACSDIPEAPKVNVTLLGDNRCGPDCDTKRLEGMIRGKVGNPVVTTLDYLSPEGKKMFGSIKPVSLPAAIFDSTLDADADAKGVFSRGIKESGNYKVFSMGGWNPACADEGGCNVEECKQTMQCRTEIPKKVDVFVMAQCPFGVKGLDAMKEVMENFKGQDAIDFTVHYIGDGDAKSGLKSMHGQGEVDEDVREACAIKHYPKDNKYMDYIWCRNKAIRDTNWQSCTGGSTGIDTQVIQKCSEGDEGKSLVEKSFNDSRTAGMQASPTWLANNKYKFSGIDAETIKSNICAHNKLANCDKKLSGPPAPQGGAQQPGCGG